MVNRPDRVKKALTREISDLLNKEIKDPRLSGIVSVTDVELSGDCRHAKVFVSVFGSEEEQKSSMKALESSTGFIRTEVGKRIKMRHTPEIIFRMDDSLERGSRVSQLIDKISRGEL